VGGDVGPDVSYGGHTVGSARTRMVRPTAVLSFAQ
jgi:hypothetical protein